MKNKVWKQFTATILAAGMAVSMAACGTSSASSASSAASAAASSVSESTGSASESTSAAAGNSSSVSASAGSSSSDSSEAVAGTSVVTESGSSTDKKTQYPVTVKTYGSDGSEIETTYDKAPEKVVAVYQGSIESMLALGLEDHLVAAAGLDNEVPDSMKDAFSKVKYLDEFTPSKETITMLEPDMILSWGSLFQDRTLGDTMDWINKGVNVYINSNTANNNNPRTLENEYKDLLNLGIIFDVQDRAEAIVNKMKKTISDTLAQTSDLNEKPKVLILESQDDTLVNYGADTLGGDMVTKLGGELLDPDADEMGKEDIVAANPDVIFTVYMPYSGDDPETVKQQHLSVIKDDKTLQSVNAVKNGRVVPIMLSEMYASATRTQDGIEDFAKGLYPDANLTFDD